ncbi:unnamed protein product [Rotaria sp. Silwood1]|nr:unnamed protein product [Rotaria sp. Silwood1]CAF1452082.1 unnamed protein product [Rotaria sp. Silwood1]CAF3575173.1 unnamed protein product [Rotaria sp. Silwood1]CAF3640710.1 unnamed protein product [Rotaria sp. Silwood1]CAF3642595.1 unnamed protein product [Rotaria sp. Silwood1]
MSSHITDVEGDWKIVDYPNHPGNVNCKIEIKGYGLDPNMFKLYMHVVNDLYCILKHNSTTNRWEISDFCSTEISGSRENIEKEDVFRTLISNLRKLEVHDEQQLIITTNDNEQVRLERLS